MENDFVKTSDAVWGISGYGYYSGLSYAPYTHMNDEYRRYLNTTLENPKPRKALPGIEKVIFNYPATIVFWSDGTKTVVKSGWNDIFDPEKGLAMAISKKALGNRGNYYNVFRKWLKEHEVNQNSMISELAQLHNMLQRAFIQGFSEEKRTPVGMREAFEEEESV